MKEHMSEPITTGVAGFAGAKAFGALGLGAAFAAVVVMIMTLPKTGREWAVGLISTVIGSIAGGAYVIVKYDLLHGVGQGDDINTVLQLCSVLGVAFACGLPAWSIVRAAFLYMERHRTKDLGELINQVRGR